MIKSGSTTILSATAKLVGEMEAEDEIILAGTFEGTLRTTRSVQVTSTGIVNGEIQAESVLVLGRVSGPIRAADRIELQASAVVTGNLAAQHVRIQDDVIFNGNCSITGPEAARRQYLVPAVVQGFGDEPASQAMGAVQRAAESFMRDFGFEMELSPERPVEGGLRPIFRSREAMPYAHLRERLRFVEHALQTATLPEPAKERRVGGLPWRKESAEEAPPQTTGADGARALVEALAQLRNAALMLGPVIVTRFEEERGARLNVRVRADSLPADVPAAAPPDPSNLLVSLQKVQAESMRDLTTSVEAHRERPRSGG